MLTTDSHTAPGRREERLCAAESGSRRFGELVRRAQARLSSPFLTAGYS